MLRKKSLVHIAVLTAGIVLLASSVSEAQRRRPGGNRGPGGGRNFGGSTLDITVEALQDELKLTPEQKKRVKQLQLQMRGTRALRDDDAVKKELGISSTQEKKMEEITTAAYSREKMREIFGDRNQGGNFEERRKKFDEYRKKVNSQVMDVLTTSQKRKWEEMLGKPADTSKFRRQFNFGRRPGGKNRPDSKKKRPDV